MATVEEINNAFLILERDPDQRLNFQLMPDEITDIKSVNWASVPIVGRSEPIRIYASSSARVIGLELMFAASVDAEDKGTPEDLVRKIRWLQSLAYTDQIKRTILSPPVLILAVGLFLDVRCVLTSVSVRWRGPWARLATTETTPRSAASTPQKGLLSKNTVFDKEDDTGQYGGVAYPHVAVANLLLEEVRRLPATMVEVREGLTKQ